MKPEKSDEIVITIYSYILSTGCDLVATGCDTFSRPVAILKEPSSGDNNFKITQFVTRSPL